MGAKEIETLERAGIIGSISPWASPVVIVPEKPGEPPRKNVHRLLKNQQNNLKSPADGGKGISLIPLPKKLKGYKVFSSHLRSGYYHIS